jgi:hypothetical protein
LLRRELARAQEIFQRLGGLSHADPERECWPITERPPI